MGGPPRLYRGCRYTRGKALSPDAPVPYEHEVTDVNAVIDWITHQSWSDGRVGMYGGSYEGFSQWAAAKHLHPALKTIVPYVAAIPGQGIPMENNVFINANYAWPFYVTNTKYLDNKTYFDNARWRALPNKWYASGAAYNCIDSIDGTPNPWLHRWLQHPAFDAYWQAMVPYKQDFASINIPVLTVTGYYDDGQISALQYLNDHYRYNPKSRALPHHRPVRSFRRTARRLSCSSRLYRRPGKPYQHPRYNVPMAGLYPERRPQTSLHPQRQDQL